MQRLGLLLLLLAGVSFAQDTIPPGTILPVQLTTSIDSQKSKAGQSITGRIMQDVPLSDGTRIRAGSKVLGRVIAAGKATSTSGAEISVRFDTLKFAHKEIPIKTALRALASMMAVEDAQLPETGPDRGTPPSSWTTDQIGGDVVYRGGGPVAHGLETVGKPVPGGVLVVPKYGAACGRAPEASDRSQALWVFSAGACGVFNLPGIAISETGREDAAGFIILQGQKDVKLRSGSGLLLIVR